MLCWREGRQWTVPLPDYFVMVFTVVRWEIYILHISWFATFDLFRAWVWAEAS